MKHKAFVESNGAQAFLILLRVDDEKKYELELVLYKSQFSAGITARWKSHTK